MVRLTPELIAHSTQFSNCVGERELDLRGYQIPALENLAVTSNQFDVIDVTANAITVLPNLPPLPRLKTLLASNNRIARIAPGFAKSLPNLQSLILVGNQIRSLGDIEELSKCKKLERLSLVDNPVAKENHYRLYLVHKVPSLRALDYAKVKESEREEAKKLFGGSGGEKLMKKLEQTSAAAKVFVPGELGLSEEPDKPSAEDIAAVRAAIQNAKSIDEVARMEKALKQGRIQEALQALKSS
mmetsp:Transcript_10160/g.31081  ORF Transcript_10160/g.31081 Transcript_10160/m.31081 type:complete len:242 (-) Transcript_10160:103-828(-)|eukprot:CAMPEP_0198733358 /NCGR_PEP_ID=MMETSP1475-20131203/45085_1 /TAXON_ID= ORGANISM="Unidentified sp., Strain CCMP1999" /NCGR_SAMPLE_ID=MMETSP1475 /ASSEMBLY_ACC=CAM_ASM_001111 /LENGTH=241 /DNA_ID=CAMNT_0044496643 /DNA_START=348 /DNA_END=1073 /DNA_ORIENTATION=-